MSRCIKLITSLGIRLRPPPLIILKGPKKNKGIVDGLRNLLQQSITDVKHDEITLPYKRFLLYARNKRNICTPYLFKNPEREKYLFYSKPALIFPEVEVILHKDTYAKLGSPASLSIEDLFKEHKFHLVTNNIRSYNPEIDDIIRTYEMKKQVSRHSGSTSLVFRFVVTKRADFMIDFPNRLLYWAQELNLDPDTFLTVPIKEAHENSISYIACPKTQWGATVIDKVNEALNTQVPTKNYLDILKRWAPETLKPRIEILHKTLIRKNKEAL